MIPRALLVTAPRVEICVGVGRGTWIALNGFVLTGGLSEHNLDAFPQSVNAYRVTLDYPAGHISQSIAGP